MQLSPREPLVPRHRASTHKRSLSLPTPRTSTRNPFMFHRAYGARGSHGQLAKPGEKHREGKPSTETRRGRPHLDVSTHHRARTGDPIAVPESGRRSRVVARTGTPGS